MRPFLWNSSEGHSFQDYVNSSNHQQPMTEYLTKRKIPICSNGKEVSLDRMFQNQRDSSSSYQMMSVYGGISNKKSKLVSYKFNQYQNSQDKQKNKFRKEFFPKQKNFMSSTFHSTCKPEGQSKALNSQRNWRKLLHPKNFPSNLGQLIVNAEAVVWQEKKTSSLGDIVYCPSDKIKPCAINQIHRLKELKQRRQIKLNLKKQVEKKPNTQLKSFMNMDRIEIVKSQLKEHKRPRKIRHQLIKIQSQPKIQQSTIDEQQKGTQETISFLDLIEPVLFQKPLFNVFQVKDQIFGQAFSIVQTKDNQNPQLLYEHQGDIRMEIASLTKTMTCLLILLLTDKFNINRKQSEVKINQKAARLKGTTAGLQYSDYVKLEDLLYGLMLPSGNDAALALAQWGGKTIRLHCGKRKSYSPSNKQRPSTKLETISKKSHISLFIFHMNSIAKALCLRNTKFSNVHGLINKRNYSSSGDLVRLCLYAMKRQDFRKIVNSRQHKCLINNKMYAKDRQTVWINTNKLLQIEGFCGVKTGITPTAGPCLASCFEINSNEHIYIVLLKTKSLSHRFQQSKRLLIEILRLLYSKTNKKQYLTLLNKLTANADPDFIEDFEDRNEVQDQQCVE